MGPKELIKTIYYGDRAITGIFIDTWKDEVRLRVNRISRVRGEEWNFYSDEDIDSGLIAFGGVSHFELSPKGLIPNDQINAIRADLEGDGQWRLSVEATCGNASGYHKANIVLIAKDIWLEDPSKPEIQIRD